MTDPYSTRSLHSRFPTSIQTACRQSLTVIAATLVGAMLLFSSTLLLPSRLATADDFLSSNHAARAVQSERHATATATAQGAPLARIRNAGSSQAATPPRALHESGPRVSASGAIKILRPSRPGLFDRTSLADGIAIASLAAANLLLILLIRRRPTRRDYA